jgi:hypothetical protein
MRHPSGALSKLRLEYHASRNDGAIVNRMTAKEDIVGTTSTATRRPVAFALSLGVLGGAALIATVSLSHRGPLIYRPYALIVLTTAAYIRLERVQGFGRRFALSLATFMVGTVLLYAFIGLVQAKTLFLISPLGHTWRLGFMLALGACLSAAVAQLTSTHA